MAEATVTGGIGQIPGMRQLMLLGSLAISIAAGVMAAMWLWEPNFSLLYSNISGQEASEVVAVLSAAEIPYEIDRKSGAILVPDGQVHEARLKLASQGLPRGSGFGLESIAGESGFSTSQFMETARYHHALETELARTVTNLRPVQNARVHLALPKASAFLRSQSAASASVMISLYPGRKLEQSQVSAIVHLVASSIPNLSSAQITVVDQQGVLLSSPDDSSEMAISTQQFEYVRNLEASYVNRIERLLIPLLGPGRIRATVSADMDFTVVEETREQYDPDNTVVRSEQISEDRTENTASAGGIPGALSNQPPAAADPAAQQSAAGAPVNQSSRQTRNFELNRTLSHTRQPTNRITRLAVAVVVDDKDAVNEEGETISEPLTATELEELTQIVKEAVGFSEQRGDTISVSNVSFYSAPELEPMEEPGLLENAGLRDILKQILSAILVLVIGLMVVRPLIRSLGLTGTPPPAVPAIAGSAGAAMAAAALDSGPPKPLTFDDKVSVARQLADKNPERVAQIVRSWVQTDE